MSSSGKIVGLVALIAVLWAASWSPGRGQQGDAKQAQCKLPEVAADVAVNDAQAERKIREALQGETVMEFVETPLSDVVDYVKDYHEIEVQFDAKALADAKVPQTTAISFNVRGISLKSGLKLLLQPLGLTTIYADRALLITSFAAARQRLRTKIYDVADLLEQDRLDRTRSGWDYEPLTQYVQTVVWPNSWRTAGGEGAIGTRFGLLAIDQSDNVQEQIELLLRDTRRALEARKQLAARKKEERGKQPAVAAAAAPATDGQAEQKIRAALQSPTVLEFVETPLPDVVDFLKDYHKIEIQLDKRALTDAGLDTDLHITNNARGLSLAIALKKILTPLDLTAFYTNEVLLVTTTDEAGQELRIKVYDVSDLLKQDRRDRVHEALKQFIQTVVAPTTWMEVGGPGSMGSHLGLLAVCQTDDAHRQLARFLEETRNAIRFRAPLPPIERKE